MLSWAQKRKLHILLAVIFIIIVVILIPLILNSPKEQTCFDNIKNQDELNIDCGGSCQKLCKSQIVPPIVLWSKAFEVSTGLYSAVALIENRNNNSYTDSIDYTFKLRDKNNELISEKKGTSFIANERIFVIFESRFKIESEPQNVEFEFSDDSIWKRTSNLNPDVSIKSQKFTRLKESPRLDIQLENKSIHSIPKLEVVAVIFDGEGVAVGASRTFVDNFKEGSTTNVVFTWPKPFNIREEICQVPLDIALLIDRSGSMSAESLSPPEPLTTVKDAASLFIDAISDKDQVAVISFSSTASYPIDLNLSLDKEEIKQSIKNIEINTDRATQYTNIGDGLIKADEELNSIRNRTKAEKIVVLLTDGELPNQPVIPEIKDYPEIYARNASKNLKDNNIVIFTIGLGKKFDGSFLRSISTTPNHYRAAPSSIELKNIYLDIATEICREGPSIVEVFTRAIQDIR